MLEQMFPSPLRRELIRFFPFIALSLLASILLEIRMIWTDSLQFFFLIWNIFLAALPLGASALLRIADRNGTPLRRMIPLGMIWLLFLPNSPYILTDTIHLRSLSAASAWFDLLLILVAAAAGLFAFIRSLIDVEDLVRQRLGRKIGIIFSFSVLFLSSYGIYLGRYIRLNSWDALLHPLDVASLLLSHVIHPFDNRSIWIYTLLFSTALSLLYALARTFRSCSLSTLLERFRMRDSRW